jgi:hypothetical protein
MINPGEIQETDAQSASSFVYTMTIEAVHFLTLANMK